VGVNQLAGLDHGDRSGGNAGLFEDLGGDAVDAIAESWVERFDRLGRRGGGSQQQDRKNRATQDFRKLFHRYKSPSHCCAPLKRTPIKVTERDRGGLAWRFLPLVVVICWKNCGEIGGIGVN
jgi:hypothetical protein